MLIRKKRASPALMDCGGPAKTYLSISEMLSSTNCATLTARGTSRSTGHFPLLATVEGKRYSRFSPRRFAAGCRQCTRSKGCISCPCLYGLIRSYLHTRGHCELSSTSTKCISLPSGGRSERGPRVGIPLELFYSATSVSLPSHLEGPAKSVALGPSYDAVRLHTPICSNLL